MIEEPKNILIIKPSALGDIVLALPALSAIRRTFPKAKISWLVRSEYADLLTGHPDLNEVILFDRRFLGKSWYKPKAFSELLKLLRQLRKERFDFVFDFQGLFRTGFMTWVTGCGRRFGNAGAREFAHLFYTHKIIHDSACVHLVDYYMKMAAAAGAKKEKVEFKLPQDPKADETVQKILQKNSFNSGKYVVILPGAARPEKLWPIERFTQLADKISSQFGLSIITAGSQTEQPYIETLKASAKSKIVNLAGQTSLKELIALLKGAFLVISNDTGPGHIAAALNVPLVMIFGPTNPARLHPYRKPESIVGTDLNAMGMKIESFDPKYGMHHITVEQVFEKVCQQISKNSL